MSSRPDPGPLPRLNRLRTWWADGGCAFGAIATIGSVQTVQILARSGLDFIIIAMEHGPIHVQTCHAKIPLDLGARGICFPRTGLRPFALSYGEAR